MNYFKLLAGALVLLTACGNDDDSGKNAGRPHFNEGFKYLKSLNVSDARMIIRRESASRAAEGSGYWKIDFSGNETKLVIADSLGQSHDIAINKIVKLSDRLLLVDPDVIQILDLLSPIGPDETIGVPLFGYLSIVDVKTEKLYRWPQKLKRILGTDYEWNFTTAADGAENLYFTLNRQWDRDQIYKLDVGDFTIRPLIPEGLAFTDFAVTDDGYVFFWHRFSDSSYARSPGGKIIPLTGKGFCLDERIYSAEDSRIFRWESDGSDGLRRKEICPAEVRDVPLLFNSVRKTAVFEGMHSEAPRQDFFWAVEFDGTRLSEPFELPDAFRDENLLRSPEFPVTSRAWYIPGKNTLRKLRMQDYADSSIPVPDYEIQQIRANVTRPDLHFRGFRYSDGKNVAGTITEADDIVIDAVSDNGRIIELIPID